MAEKASALARALGSVSNSDTDEQIVRLPLDLIDPDPDNFYSLAGLDELAGNIELCGLLDPIRVRPNGERYTVVSGHRRRAACMMIRDGGSEQFADGVPCIVDYGEASDAMRKLRLIFANSSSRQLTSAEQSRQAEEVTRLLYELKEQGVEFPGRMRDHVAEACHLTSSKLARLHAIRENLKPELLTLYDQGKINESSAYELQRLPMDVQRYLAGKKKVVDGEISGEGVKICVERAEKYLHPTCKCPDGSACSHTLPRFYQTAVSRYWDCRGGCCLECPHTETYCPYQCAQAKKRVEARRQKDREAKALAEETEKQRHDKNRAKIAGQYMAYAILAKAAGVSATEPIHVPGAYTLSDMEAKAANPEKIPDYNARNEEVFDQYTYIREVRAFADLVGVSVDFLLGRTDEPAINTGEAAAAAAPVWRTDDPPEPGEYGVWSWFADWEPDFDYKYWTGSCWAEGPLSVGPCIDHVLAWFPLPPRSAAPPRPDRKEAEA